MSDEIIHQLKKKNGIAINGILAKARPWTNANHTKKKVGARE